MDRRINYKIVLDTETAPMNTESNEVLPSNMLVYDIGWVVTDKRGTIYKTRSFLNCDVFVGERELMKSAYYAKKIPNYWKEVAEGKRILASSYEIRQALFADIEAYETKEVYAHNARFDYGALNNTERWLTKSKYRYYFPKEIEICDTLKMARDVLGTMPTYKKFCEENGFMTKHKTPRPQYTAEVIYRYITKDVDFVEQHTGLEDVLIETAIMAYCYRQHKKMRKLLFEN